MRITMQIDSETPSCQPLRTTMAGTLTIMIVTQRIEISDRMMLLVAIRRTMKAKLIAITIP